MMEAMQMSPVVYGPQMVGPGIGSIGGCVFDASIGRGAYSRITKVNQRVAENAMVVDAATAFSEQKGEIGHYKLLVRSVPYRDKITNEIINEKTLVSADFNFEAAGVWTSAGENGTVGTIEEYRATVDRANLLAQTEGDTSMFWVSPSAKGEVHRAYLWVKTGDEVEAFQYIVPGSKDAVSTMMKKLGFKDGDSKPLEEQTIIRLVNEPKIHHKDVYDAIVLSLSSTELEKAKPILDNFKKEAELPDSFREKRLQSYKGEYEAKLNNEILKKAYENDIEKWLKSVAQGFAAIPNVIARSEATRQSIEHASSRSKVLQPLIPGIIGLTGILVDNNMKSEKKSEYAFPDTTLSLRAPMAIGVNSAKSPQMRDPAEVEQSLNLPAQAEIATLVSLARDDNLSTKARYHDSSSESVFWREFISAIFEPLPDSGNWVNAEYSLMTSEPRSLNDQVELLGKERNFPEVLMQLFPMMNADKEDESDLSRNKEGLMVLATSFQQGLEVIAALIKSEANFGLVDGQKVELTGRQKVETEIVNLGEEIIIQVFKDGLLPQYDAFAQLAFLLLTYHDKNSSQEVKQLISTLICRQVKIMHEDNALISEFPQLQKVFEKFLKVVPQAKFLEDRFGIIIAIVDKLFAKDSVFSKVKNDRDFLRKLIFLICKIIQLPAVIEDYPEQNISNLSIERLRLNNHTGNYMHNLFKYQNKKKMQRKVKCGIIYLYPTCFTEYIYDKIERKG